MGSSVSVENEKEEEVWEPTGSCLGTGSLAI